MLFEVAEDDGLKFSRAGFHLVQFLVDGRFRQIGQITYPHAVVGVGRNGNVGVEGDPQQVVVLCLAHEVGEQAVQPEVEIGRIRVKTQVSVSALSWRYCFLGHALIDF